MAKSVSLEQQVRESQARAHDARIGDTDNRKKFQQAQANLILGVVVNQRKQSEKSVEGIVDVAADHIEIGYGECGGSVGGIRPSGRAYVARISSR